MKKTNNAVKIHNHSSGTVQAFTSVKEASKSAAPSPKKTIRDVVGAAQTPSIRESFVKPTR